MQNTIKEELKISIKERNIVVNAFNNVYTQSQLLAIQVCEDKKSSDEAFNELVDYIQSLCEATQVKVSELDSL